MEDNNLDRLIKKLYSSLVNPTGFTDFLIEFNDSFQLCLSCIDVFNNEISSKDVCWRVEDDRYANNIALSSTSIRNEVVSSLYQVPLGEQIKVKVLDDKNPFLKDERENVSIILVSTNDWVCRLLFQYNQKEANTSFDEVLLDKILPYLQHAIELYLIKLKNNKSTFLQDTFLHQTLIPIILLDSSGAIHLCNHHAKIILEQHQVLQQLDKKIEQSSMKNSRRLAAAIKKCKNEGRTHILPLKMEDSTELVLTFIPLLQKLLDTTTGIAVFIYSDNHILINKEILCQLYDLTTKEALVCSELVAGRPLTEIAKVTFLSYQTVRTYIKRIMAKTSTHRQSELIVKILTSPACNLIDKMNR